MLCHMCFLYTVLKILQHGLSSGNFSHEASIFIGFWFFSLEWYN